MLRCDVMCYVFGICSIDIMLMRMMKGREKKKSETKLRTDRTNETESKKGQNLRYSKKNEKTVVMESKWDKNEEREKQKTP